MPSRNASNEAEAVTPDRARLDTIFQDCYGEIKRRIRQALRQESHPTLQTTDIAHDLYLNLVKSQGLSFEDTRAVLNLIAYRTREYLVERARRTNARKRGGNFVFVSLTAAADVGHEEPLDVLVLSEALAKLAAESPEAAEIAHLRWFIGLTEKEIAPIISRSRSHIQRSWEFTKLWLADFLSTRPQRKEEPRGQ
jgi:RNA polymerase sigma factor (TIGR02999 family)